MQYAHETPAAVVLHSWHMFSGAGRFLLVRGLLLIRLSRLEGRYLDFFHASMPVEIRTIHSLHPELI